jgi:hypothetical protein
MRGNVSGSLNLLCLGSKRKVKCYNGYLINEYVFHIKEYGQGRKTYNSGVCLVNQLLMSLKLIIMKS